MNILFITGLIIFFFSACIVPQRTWYKDYHEFDMYWDRLRYIPESISDVQGEYRQYGIMLTLRPDSTFTYKASGTDVPSRGGLIIGKYKYSKGQLFFIFQHILENGMMDSTKLSAYENSFEGQLGLIEMSHRFSPSYLVRIDRDIIILTHDQRESIVADSSYVQKLKWNAFGSKSDNDRIYALLKVK